jgi:hypothetical protein
MASAKTVEALCDVLRAIPNELIELDGRKGAGGQATEVGKASDGKAEESTKAPVSPL